jgi:ABC-type taurine transport system substrate-binding protein
MVDAASPDCREVVGTAVVEGAVADGAVDVGGVGSSPGFAGAPVSSHTFPAQFTVPSVDSRP